MTYLLVLIIISIYGVHRYYLVYLFRRHVKDRQKPADRFSDLPLVTVQLPLYNEANVSQRIIDATCQLDYPADRLQIQVLDDSTDTSLVASTRHHVQQWQARGVNIQHIHRSNRRGYKAGALADAMESVTGQFIAIFDADFIPPANFLKRTIHHFTNPKIGMVQTRWAHLNRNYSLLTQCQAILLDGHFVIEHTARNRSGCCINFNGTAGIWRTTAILGAGGWQADTLTEDVDLSYRSQLAGWRFIYLPWITCQAELPPEINAFKTQQHRWTKGTIQTAIKLLPRILMSDLSWSMKREAFFHLTCPIVYACVCLMAVLFYPVFFISLHHIGNGALAGLLWGLMLFATGTVSAGAFYMASQHALKYPWWSTFWRLPFLMALGIGIAINNTRALLEAILGFQSPFIRTPKYNEQPALVATNMPFVEQSASPDNLAVASQPLPSPKQRKRLLAIPSHWLSLDKWMPLCELAMGLYMLECIRMALTYKQTRLSLVFLILFAWGYFSIGLASFYQSFITPLIGRWRMGRPSKAVGSAPSSASQQAMKPSIESA